ncbi:MAG: hypothetical protein WKF88_01275 [Ferruginibacter sp.]
MNRSLLSAATILFAVLLFSSCKKESFITGADARLGISADTLRFDTVFTTTGSVTQSFKIFNNNDQKLKLSSVKLMGGPASPFKINVNGIASTEVINKELAANDSIYVFVTVTINPTAANLPFILRDSIAINYNGNTRFVQLEAFGQNAVFIRNGIISGNVSFTNTLPYVILGVLQVTNTGVLTLNAGTRIFAHADAPILVDGQLVSNGTKMQPVIFAGDRLDVPYNSFPAAWPGIYFRAGSKDNALQFTYIKNAYRAVVVDQPAVNPNPKLILKQCIIDNAFDAGLMLSNTSIVAENSLISNCGRDIFIEYGGNYSFTHCTVVAYSNDFVLHQRAAIYLSDANATNQSAPLSATLRNCIFYGDAGFVDSEIQTNRTGSNPFSVNVDHCLYRANTDPGNTIFTQSIKNQDPSFDSLDVQHDFYDFRITKNAAAPGINKGIATGLIKDLDDKNRNVGLPDLGAYEKQ